MWNILFHIRLLCIQSQADLIWRPELGQTHLQPMHLLLTKNNNQPHQNIQGCVCVFVSGIDILPHSRSELSHADTNSKANRISSGQFQTMADLHVVESSFSRGKI